MVLSLVVTGSQGLSASDTIFISLNPTASQIANTTESAYQVRIYDTLTVNNLLVRCQTNGITGSSTIRTRKNTANGNLSVAIAGGSTGVFQDITNSDSLVSGDLYNYQAVGGAGGTSLTAHIISLTVDATTAISLLNGGWSNVSPGSISFHTFSFGAATEATGQTRIRFAATWDRLGANVVTNTNNGTTTIRSRVNGANGNQVLSISASTTGYFEDTVNSDSVVSADLLNFSLNHGGASGVVWVQPSQSRIKPVSGTVSLQFAGDSTTIDAGLTRPSLIGGGSDVGTELNTRLLLRGGITWTFQNLFFRVTTNTINGSTTTTCRKNAANGNQSVSISASTTGIFEDTSNTDNYVDGDDINALIVAGGSTGTMTYTMVIFQPSVAPTPVVSFITSGRTIDLSGVRSLILRAGNYIIEHQIPGMSGGILERVGLPANRLEVIGFFFSGSDDQKNVLINSLGLNATVTALSTISGNIFVSAVVFVDRIVQRILPGRGYPYYEWDFYTVVQS